jgi:hypothetical protein
MLPPDRNTGDNIPGTDPNGLKQAIINVNTEAEAATATVGGYAWDAAGSSGLNFAYGAGLAVNPSTGAVVSTPAGTVALTNNATNYVYVSTAGVVSAATAVDLTKRLIFQVVTSGGAFSAGNVTDMRLAQVALPLNTIMTPAGPSAATVTNTSTYISAGGQFGMAFTVGTGKTVFWGLLHSPTYRKPIGAFMYSASTGLIMISTGGAAASSFTQGGDNNQQTPGYTAGAGYNFDTGGGGIGVYSASYSGSTFTLTFQSTSTGATLSATVMVFAL